MLGMFVYKHTCFNNYLYPFMDEKILTDFFNSEQTYTQGTAPGRMDVMGGIADYSGSMVLQMPIKETTTVAIALRTDGLFRLKSIPPEGHALECSITYKDLLKDGREVNYTFVKEQLKKNPGGEWASYVVGCFLVLQQEKGIQISGADILIYSQVPIGKGVSSSAALEIATMKALVQIYGLTLGKTELPALAQKVENLVVGAPCGLMDQLTSYLGEPGKLLPILCQPDIIYPSIPLPEGIRFVGIDSGMPHSVGGASYTEVRTAAFMGYTMIAKELGITPEHLASAKEKGDYSQLPYKGYLANISPAVFEVKFALRLFYKMAGQYFIQHYPVHIDPATAVDSRKFYAILDCSRHPVYENFRVQTFIVLLHYLAIAKDTTLRQQCLQQLGELMYQSHAGYTICGLGNSYTTELVEMVRDQAGKGIYGAKITGGGSGGTVCMLCDGEEGLQTARNIHAQYQEKHGKEVRLFV